MFVLRQGLVVPLGAFRVTSPSRRFIPRWAQQILGGTTSTTCPSHENGLRNSARGLAGGWGSASGHKRATFVWHTVRCYEICCPVSCLPSGFSKRPDLRWRLLSGLVPRLEPACCPYPAISQRWPRGSGRARRAHPEARIQRGGLQAFDRRGHGPAGTSGFRLHLERTPSDHRRGRLAEVAQGTRTKRCERRFVLFRLSFLDDRARWVHGLSLLHELPRQRSCDRRKDLGRTAECLDGTEAGKAVV